MAEPFRYAICNEIFGSMSFAENCRLARKSGFEGIEVAPYTLDADPVSLSADRRADLRDMMHNEGLCFAGLHWLLRSPGGMHLTTGDTGVRQKSWAYLRGLVELASELAICQHEYNAVMVLGSPAQRSTVDGMSKRDATDLFTHELAHTAAFAESHGIRILVEALSPDQTDVITSLKEAIEIVKQIGSPAVQTLFDVHNAVAERDVHPELIRRYASHIQHVHLNELDGGEPGQGSYNFGSLMQALQANRFHGWYSIEMFGEHTDAALKSQRALDFLRQQEPANSRAAYA